MVSTLGICAELRFDGLPLLGRARFKGNLQFVHKASFRLHCGIKYAGSYQIHGYRWQTMDQFPSYAPDVNLWIGIRRVRFGLSSRRERENQFLWKGRYSAISKTCAWRQRTCSSSLGKIYGCQVQFTEIGSIGTSGHATSFWSLEFLGSYYLRVIP